MSTNYRIRLEGNKNKTADCRNDILERCPIAMRLMQAQYATRRCANQRLPQITHYLTAAGIEIPAGARLVIVERPANETCTQ